MSGPRLVVGLGNPGERYAGTRHNLGFRVVERLASRLGAGEPQTLCGSSVQRAGDWVLARPATFMNRSGWAVACLADRFEPPPDRLLVVYDDVALPLGRLRLRAGGGPAGHRGMESILEEMRSPAVPRLRLGVAPADGLPAGELSEFVLAPFDEKERNAAEALVERGADAVEAWAELGVEAAMARVNGPPTTDVTDGAEIE